jgi:hypothetical protein
MAIYAYVYITHTTIYNTTVTGGQRAPRRTGTPADGGQVDTPGPGGRYSTNGHTYMLALWGEGGYSTTVRREPQRGGREDVCRALSISTTSHNPIT